MTTFRVFIVFFLSVSTVAEDKKTPSTFYYSQIIADFQKFYRTGCTFVITSNVANVHLRSPLPEIVKYFSSRRVSIAQVTFKVAANATEEMFPCANNRPFFVVIAENGDMEELFRGISEVSAYPTWLIFVNTGTTSFVRVLESVDIPFDCEMVVAEEQNNDITFSEIYRVHRNLPVLTEQFGRWSQHGGLESPRASLNVRRGDLRGFTFKVATLNSPPIIKLNSSNPKNKDPIHLEGFFGDVWSVLQERMNFTSSYYFPADNGYGSQVDNGSWNGMIAMILKGEVDVAINEFTMTVGRADAVDFMQPIIFTSTNVIIRQPTTLSLRWDNFLAPFAGKLWVAVLESILVIGVVLGLVYKVGRYFGNADSGGPPRYTVATSLFYVYGVFCQQGDDVTPKSTSSRAVHLLAGLMSITVLAAYSGGLVSYLTVGVTSLPFNTFQEMLDDGSYTLAVLAKSGKLNLLETTTDSLLQQLYTKHLLPDKDSLPSTVQEGLLLACLRNKYSFMTAYDIAVGMMADLPCRLVAVKRASFPDAIGMILPKSSPYRELFNYNLQFLRNAGVINRLRVNAWTKSMPEAMTSFSSVTLAAVTPIFTIIATGICLCALLLCFEIVVREQCRNIMLRRNRRAKKTRYRRRVQRIWVQHVST